MKILCPIRWLVYLAGFLGYFVFIRIGLFATLASAKMLNAFHFCFLQFLAARATGKPFSFDDCMAKKIDRLDSYYRKLEAYEGKLQEFGDKILGPCA